MRLAITMDVHDNSSTCELLARCQLIAEAPGLGGPEGGLGGVVKLMLLWLVAEAECQGRALVAVAQGGASEQRTF